MAQQGNDRPESVHPLAGQPVPPEQLIDVGELKRRYRECRPRVEVEEERVKFGTSGHRGTPEKRTIAADGKVVITHTFTEAHILAITQAICEMRQNRGITGPLFLGMDTHALSTPAQETALEVLAANGVETCIQREDGYTPTPAISLAILSHNRAGAGGQADGIVITPSHNPPEDGGFKYNPPEGGPADTKTTGWIQDRANALLRDGLRAVKRVPYETALQASTTHAIDYVQPYVEALSAAIDMEAIRAAGVRIGVDPLGGAAVGYWDEVKARYGLDLTVTNARIDPTFSFMTLDHDGKVRMDCSSPDAMAGLVGLKDRFDVAFGTDPDADRHGIVTRSAGLLNPNHYLAVAIHYLLTHREQWQKRSAVGKTVVSSSLIDRVVAALGWELKEVPVGFKWFAPGLFDGSLCFGGEESAGASFLRRDGTVWTTDKDGLLLGLLAAEITARTGKDPGEQYQALAEQLGTPYYVRLDVPASPEEKARLGNLSPDAVTDTELAGEPIQAKLTRAPGNDQPIGGLKVVAHSGWFAVRPSGTEDLYKLYAESFESEAHRVAIVAAAKAIVRRALG